MYHYRPVGPDDLDLICRHRYEMFKTTGRTDEVLSPMAEGFRPWLEPRLAGGSYLGWIADGPDRPVGSVGFMVIDWAPHPLHPTQDRRGYVMNAFVEADHRGRGVAKRLMEQVLAEGRRLGLAYLTLHASAMGQPLYETLGWTKTNEMSLALS